MKLSLRIKTICAVLFSALLLAGTAALISYRVYSEAIYEQYETMTMNLARTTAVTVDEEEVLKLRDEVVRIYREICEEYGGVPDFKQFTDEDWEAYYAGYAPVYEMDAYKHILEQLYRINDANHVSSIYIGYMDTETLYGIYLVDGAAGADACPPGTCDPFEESNLERMEQGDYDFPAYVTNYEEYGWLCSAGAGIYDGNGEVVATALVDISMEDVMKNRQDFLMNLCIVLAGITLFLLIVLIVLLGKIVLSPINSLAKAAASFVSEKEKHGEGGGQSAISSLEIHTGDEIEYLSDSIRQMEREINSYIENLTAVTAEKERMGAELNVATQIQASMLPCIFPAFPERNEFDIYASMEPAKEVGGDFYDFFMVDEDHLALVIADVSGKGVPAALFMVIAKTLLKNSALDGSSPKEILERVNNQLCENNEAEMFVTVWLGILTISTGQLVCANAGHEYPAVRRKGGAYELLRNKHGFILAGMEGVTYREYEIKLNPGDALFVYTDGVPEAADAGEELFGTDRMLDALNAGGETDCEHLLETVRKYIDLFVGDAPQFDDITMMSVLYKGDQKAARAAQESAMPAQAAEEPAIPVQEPEESAMPVQGPEGPAIPVQEPEKPAMPAQAAEELTVSAQLGRLDEVLDFVQTCLNGHDCPKKAKMQLAVATEELFVNIARYAYGDGEGTASVQIGFEENPRQAVIRFRDTGMPYNPLEKSDPDVSLPAGEREIGGLGIFMVKKSMDAMEYAYEDGTNIVTIRKFL